MEGAPEKVVVEIDLGSLHLGGEDGTTFAGYVAEVAAKKLLSFDRDVVGELRRRALKIADEDIREQLRPVIAQALEASVQRTSAFGEPRGKVQSLREVIVEAAISELQKPRERAGSSYGRGTETLVQAIIRSEVEDALGKELRQAVHDAKVDVVAAVKEKAGEVVAETIAKMAEGRRI